MTRCKQCKPSHLVPYSLQRSSLSQHFLRHQSTIMQLNLGSNDRLPCVNKQKPSLSDSRFSLNPVQCRSWSTLMFLSSVSVVLPSTILPQRLLVIAALADHQVEGRLYELRPCWCLQGPSFSVHTQNSLNCHGRIPGQR